MNATSKSRQKPTFGAKDLKRLAGITYRQLNDWESKGLIPDTREGEAQWRRFTLPQFFGLMVLAELRRRFDVRIEDLRWIGERLLREETKLLYEAAGKISAEGVPLILLTDLKTFFVIDTVTAVADFMASGQFAREPDSAFIMLKLNSLVQKLLAEFGVKMSLEEHGLGFEYRKDNIPQNPEEEKLLKLLRRADFRKLEVDLQKGEIRLITAEQVIPPDLVPDILGLIKSPGYETLSVVKQDGKITEVRRKIPIKPAELRLGIGARRRDPERS